MGRAMSRSLIWSKRSGPGGAQAGQVWFGRAFTYNLQQVPELATALQSAVIGENHMRRTT